MRWLWLNRRDTGRAVCAIVLNAAGSQARVKDESLIVDAYY